MGRACGDTFRARCLRVFLLVYQDRDWRGLQISQMMVTNLLASSLEMYDAILFTRSLKDTTHIESPWVHKLSLPKKDLDEITQEAWIAALHSD